MKSRMVSMTFILLAVAVVSCSNPEKTYTVETIDGVRYVYNHAPAWGNEPKVTLELIRKFGEAGSEDDTGYLFNPIDMVRDSRGNVYVLELTDGQIEKFAPDGTHIGTIGRKGEGPGEISMAIRMDIDRNDNIVVADGGNRRFQTFSPDGKDLGSRRMQKLRGVFRILSTGDMVSDVMPMQEEGSRHTLERLDMEGNVKSKFRPVFDFGGDETNPSNQDSRFTVTADDCIVSSFKFANCVEKHSPDGTLLFRADRPLKFDLSYKMTTQTLSDGRTRNRWLRTPVSEQLDIDYNGRIWLFSYKHDMLDMMNNPPEEETSEMYDLHIFDADGVFLGEIDPPFYPAQFRIYGDRLYLIEFVKEMVVYEYRIIEK
ncbi:hypothetical protein ACFL4Q_00630 [candidate division KSB1 bacterium]